MERPLLAQSGRSLEVRCRLIPEVGRRALEMQDAPATRSPNKIIGAESVKFARSPITSADVASIARSNPALFSNRIEITSWKSGVPAAASVILTTEQFTVPYGFQRR